MLCKILNESCTIPQVGNVPSQTLDSHCKDHTSSKALWIRWVQPRCSAQLSQPPAPLSPLPPESCTHMKPNHTQILNVLLTLKVLKAKKKHYSTVKQTEDNITETRHQDPFAMTVPDCSHKQDRITTKQSIKTQKNPQNLSWFKYVFSL